ncbi:hypothetical protein [Nocardia niigatensis]|uniref:hypothetical protein n=1 Tax=Nocardia niigatensis TaxID=209249 RepID=UPI0012F6DB2F|nr:hypothetical protein [Nocardia niigatensis]
MSGSSDTAPTPETLRDVQIWLNYLDRISPQQPATVIAETDRALPLLASWQSCDAYAWALALRAKAFRFLDDLAAVLSTANSGLTALGEHGGVISAHLHLEAGMALNQFDRQPEAAEHLRAADRAFEAANDPGGRAWALVSLAESHSGSGYPEDPEPVLTLAKHLAESVGDEPAIRRAWKQLSVVYRHRGEILNALDAIQHALDGAPDGHPRANYLLEWGHLLAWTADYAAADEAYEDAAAAYAEHGDVLGIANTERALAINALLLGRNTEGRRRLDRAVSNYREIDSAPGLGYTLRERAMLRLTEHDTAGALTDVEEALRSFRASPDTLGLAGALRAAARIRSVLGDMSGARDALSQARTITSAGSNPLAEANILLLEAEIEDTPDKRLAAAAAAANLYRRMRIATGEAHALSMTARAAADRSDTILVVSAMRQSIDALRRARRQVIDPGRRADHDFALRDVATTLLSVANVVRRPETTRMAADLLIDATPLGLRNTLQSGHLSSRVTDFLDRVRDLPLRSRTDPHSQRHLLQQLNV